MNPKIAIYYFHRLRKIIAYHLKQEAEIVFSGEIEVSESYFGGKRKGKRGRGAAGSVWVFGLLKPKGKVYTEVIVVAKSTTLHPIIERKVVPDSILYSDCWRSYNMSDASEFKNFRINYSKLFADKKNTSTGTTVSGRKSSAICANLMVLRRSLLAYF